MKHPVIFLSAGEPSGDLLGAGLMRALRKLTDNKVSFIGIGGPHMEKEGLSSMVPIEDLSVMGLAEIIPHIPKIWGHLNKTAETILTAKPDAVITIDAPAFHERLVKKLQGKDIPLVHFVAPTVWAWKEKRAERFAKIYDLMLTLLPFEPDYFTRHGLETVFVGHPIVEQGGDQGDADRFIQKYRMVDSRPNICLLPGSRRGEVTRMMPLFYDVLTYLNMRFPYANYILPTLPHLRPMIEEMTKTWPFRLTISDNREDKYDAFAASEVAIAASGTVSLELALAKLPMVITYRVNPLSYVLAKMLIKVKWVSLVNLILGKAVIPELLQYDANPRHIADAAIALVKDQDLRGQQIRDCQEALTQLGHQSFSPSERAAGQILDFLKRHKKEAA